MGLFGGEVGLGAEVEAIAAREKGDRVTYSSSQRCFFRIT